MSVIPMDESDSQQPQPDPLTNTMQPLDISDLAITWPIWQQQFQIYLLAIHDQVSERRKLAIFLNCLGPDGIALATQFFPQLKDFQRVAAQEITFEQLWSLFTDLCTKATPLAVNSFEETFNFHEITKYGKFDGNLTAAYPEMREAANKCDFRCHVCQTSYTDRMVRDQLMHIIPEEDNIIIRDLLNLKNPSSQTLISKYHDIQKDREIWALILPHLTFCDMEALSLASPAVDHIVQWFIETVGQVQIKQCCLDRFCPEFYRNYGEYVRDLTLNNISERGVQMIINFFTMVEDFALQDVEILDSVQGFPIQLKALKLINTTMELPLMKEWLSESHLTLKTLEMVNFVYSFYASSSSDRVQPLSVTKFYELTKLIIKGDVIDVSTSDYNIPCQLEFLKLSARDLTSSCFNCPKLRHLHYDVEKESHVFFGFRDATSTLVSLTLKNWLPNQPLLLSEYEALEVLKITTPVPRRYKSEIEALDVKTKIVEYEPIPVVPEEPNLIFDMLNEYCILEIMDYLSVPDWMIFGQLHATAESAVASYKYPRLHLTSTHCSDSKIYLNMEHFMYVCGKVKTYTIDVDYADAAVPFFQFASYMPALKTFNLNGFHMPQGVLNYLPVGIEKLVLKYPYEIDLTPYFKRLGLTLQFLDIIQREEHDQCLLELSNLRELRIRDYGLSIPVFTNFLEQNANTLEYLKLILKSDAESGWVCYRKLLRTIGSMGNLKVLKIKRVYNSQIGTEGVDGGCHLVADLIKKIGAQLKKLSIDVYEEDMVEILDSEELKNIPEIKILFSAPVARAAILSLVSTMKNLRKLSLRQFCKNAREIDLKRKLETPELMSLLEALPLLTHLEPDWSYESTIKFRLDLKEYLRQKNRELWICGVKI